MPTYEYECRKCKHSLEELQKVDDKPITLCPNCGKHELFRLISGGLGFYMSNRTVGIIADKHNNSFSPEYKTHLKNKNKTQKQDSLSKKLPEGATIQKPKKSQGVPWHKKNQKVTDQQLKTATPNQLANYIQTGKL